MKEYYPGQFARPTSTFNHAALKEVEACKEANGFTSLNPIHSRIRLCAVFAGLQGQLAVDKMTKQREN